MHQKELDPKLGKVLLYGASWDCPRSEISTEGIKVEKAKVEIIAKLPIPRYVKDIRSFLGHAGFYRRFINC